jgi:TolB protein
MRKPKKTRFSGPVLVECGFAFLIIAAITLVRTPAAQAAFPGTNGKIVFSSDRDGDFEIYSMNPDGSELTQLTFNDVADGYPGGSSDGLRIVFSSFRDGNWEIYAMNADGTGQTRLTDNPADDEGGGWSPDGTKIVFSSDRDGKFEIYVMNADGTGQTRLTNNLVNDLNPAWSPDGTKIAFDRGDANSAEIFVMNPDGTGETQLTFNYCQDVMPNWSPDGTKIAYRCDGAGGWMEIFVMNADGSGQLNLTNHPDLASDPAWSPDGTQLIFASNRDDPDPYADPFILQIYTMNADGSDQTRVAFSDAWDSGADWLPGATEIDIDIRPWAFPNFVCPKGLGIIPVAILTEGSFNALKVVPKSVRFGPNKAKAQGLGFIWDVDRDGDLDLILYFRTQDTGIACGDVSACLIGKTRNGMTIRGCDSVKTFGCGH